MTCKLWFPPRLKSGLLAASFLASLNLLAAGFTEVQDNGIIPDGGHSPAAAWGDFDGDGWPDLFVSSYEGIGTLYRNRGNGQFENLVEALPNLGSFSHGCSWADFDQDGRLDLFVAKRNSNPSLLYRNLGNLSFARLTEPVIPGTVGDGVGAAWGDFNGDGLPDIFFTDLYGFNRLWRNEGNGTLIALGNSPVLERDGGVGCAWGDYDGDGDLDLFVTKGGNRSNSLYRNDGGAFVKINEGEVVNNPGYSVGCAWGDYDNDGDLDLYVANRLGPNFLYRNNGNGTFTRITEGPHVTDVDDSNGCTWADYDNDCDLDLFIASFNQPGVRIYRNNGDGTFTQAADALPGQLSGYGSAVVMADYQGDGFLDLFLARWSGGNSQLLQNQGNSNGWLKIRLRGESPNYFGLGAQVRIKTVHGGSERWQMRQAVAYDGWGGTSEEIHFGLGNATEVETVRVRWLSGKVTELHNVAANQVLTVVEQPPPLEILPPAVFATFPLEVTLVSRVEGGEVRYTQDGTEPTPDSPAYTGPFTLTTSTRVRARVYKDGAPASEVLSALYLENRWNDGIPGAWRELHFGAAWFTREDAAALADADGDGANNLQEWLAGTVPTDPASRPGNPPALLTLTPPGGEFELSVTVRGTSPLSLARIHYTLDGAEPDASAPVLPEAGLDLTASATLRARAFFEGNPVSPVVQGVFTVRPVAPRITRQPANRAVLAGGNVAFECEAVGTPPLSYQWTFNDEDLPGANEPVLRLTAVQPAQAGLYRVRVSNALGSVTSEPARLTVNQPPQIVRQPESQTVQVGAPVTFTVEVIGTEPFLFEWYRNGVRIPGAPNAPAFTLSAAKPTDAGNYHVRVRNAYGMVNSLMATLTVTEQPQLPMITVHPVGQTRQENQSVALSVTAGGTPPLSYQWFRNGQPLSGATSARLEFASLRLADAGTYWVEVRNAAGAVVSQPAVLQVLPLQPGGTINFNNRVLVAGVDAPVFDEDGTTRLAGPAYLAQLYAGPTADALAPVGWAVPFRTGDNAGYVAGGSVIVVPTVAPGATASVQMRVWESARGADFESALRAGSRVGVSAVLQIPTGGAGDPPSFPADLVGLTSFRLSRETEPPVIAITSPASGTTHDDRFTLAGTITDNVAVMAAAWEWNGRAMGELALSDGRFEVAGQRLVLGENRLRVTARDAAGNAAAAEVLVVYEPARLLTLSPPPATREGRRVSTELMFTSPGGVGGLTLVVRYDPEWFRDPELTWADQPALAGALTQVNTQTAGEVRATVSLPGGALPAGALPLATLSLRARSVPDATTTPLVPALADVADVTGAALDYGNGAVPANVEITPRRLVGDHNGNDALDVGDAALIQRLIVQLDPPRAWDVPANDLNASQSLDSGDVVKVLRVVTGLDAAPAPRGPGLAGPSRHSPVRLAAVPVVEAQLTAEPTRLWPGDTVRVRVRLSQRPPDLTGVSLTVNYPATALRLSGADSVRVGAAVPAGVATVLAVDEAAGQIRFAASGPDAWPASDEPVLEIVFQLLNGPGASPWTIALSSGQVAWDKGYEVAALAATDITLHAQVLHLPVPDLTSQDGPQLEFATEPGLRYRVEVSEDLQTWTLLEEVLGTGQAQRILDPAPPVRPARFYRVLILR
jgi:hypothetical protein